MDFSRDVAKAALEIKAIKLNPDNPFEWASGFRMPIYNDNRMFLWYPSHRHLVLDAFVHLMRNNGFENGKDYDFIAGTSTAGIPWGTLVATEKAKPFVYVRDKPKDHGLRNQVEGIDAEADLQGKTGLLIEDLISTGGSSVGAVSGLRDANGKCDYCFSIFDYGFDMPPKMFAGEIPYDKEGKRKLLTPCNARSILTYDRLLQVAVDTGYVNRQQAKMLEEWREDPFTWGEKRGFPRVKK